MSERLKNINTVSNEEIVNDLTKDLQNSLEVSETKLDTNPGSSGDTPEKDNIPIPEMKAETSEPEQTSDSDGSDVESEDGIDETALKDAELDMTDDQKAERQIIAEELKRQGNEAFKAQNYELSIEKYSEGLRTCPLSFSKQRSVLHCNRSAAKMKIGRFKSAVKDCDKSIELDDAYTKAYVRRAQSYESTKKYDEALADFKKVTELDPTNMDAKAALVRIPPLIEERNEKLKTEMMGKLKDLGNMILKPFGLSTDNFKLEQDPDSKGYKINFKQ